MFLTSYALLQGEGSDDVDFGHLIDYMKTKRKTLFSKSNFIMDNSEKIKDK